MARYSARLLGMTNTRNLKKVDNKWRLRLERLESRETPTIAVTGIPDWVEQGPGPIRQGGATTPQNNEVSGCVQTIAVDPNNTAHVLVGSTDGGVWQSENVNPANPAAVTWAPLSDKLASLASGSVAFSPFDNTGNTFFVGTGQFSNSFDISGGGAGIFTTTNRGATWTLIGSNLSGLNIKTVLPTRIDLDPGPAVTEVIFAAALNPAGTRNPRIDGGALYVSRDNGATFTVETGTLANPLPGGAVTQVVEDPNAANTIYAGIPGQGVFRSTDGGVNWSAFNTGLVFTATDSHLELATQNNAGVTTVFAAVTNGGTLSGVFSSINGGNWVALAAPPAGFNAGAAFADKVNMVADPANANVVYISGQGGGSDIYRYNPAGAGSWVLIDNGGAKNNTSPHADQRDLAFIGNATLLASNDGGIYLLNNPTDAANNPWQSLQGEAANGGLRTLEFFSVGYNTNNNTTLGAAQDNATSAQPANLNQTWMDTGEGGDGSIVQYDSANNIRYALENNFGFFYRNGTQLQLRANGNPTNFSGLNASDQAFATSGTFETHRPFILNSVDPTRILIGRSGVYESDPTAITPTGNVIVTITPAGMTGRARSLAYGGTRGGTNFVNIVFVGTTTGQLFFRGEAGATFTRLDGGGTGQLGGVGAINSIVLDPQDWRRVFVIKGTHVWMSNDVTNLAANGFQDITDNLNTFSTDLRTIALYDVTPGVAGDSVILVGGQGGVYRRLPASAGTCPTGTWTLYGMGLPNVLIQQVLFENVDPDGNAANGTGRIVAGTMGRSAWSVDNVSATIQVDGALQVTGDAAANAMELRQDPNNPGRIIVSDGTGNVQSYDAALFTTVSFAGLGGADGVLVDSNGGAPGGTVDFVTFQLNVDGGGDVGDWLTTEDSSDTTADHVTITATQVGADTLDNYFGTCGMLNYTGFSKGSIRVRTSMGGDNVFVLSTHAGATELSTNEGADQIRVRTTTGPLSIFSGAQSDTISISSDASTNLGTLAGIQGAVSVDGGGPGDFDHLFVSDFGANGGSGVLSATSLTGYGMGAGGISYSAIEDFVLQRSNGPTGDTLDVLGTSALTNHVFANGGDDTTTIAGDGLAFDNSFSGGDGADATTISAGIGISGTTVTITGDGNTFPARDHLTFIGRLGDDAISVLIGLGTVAGGSGSHLVGLGQTVGYDTFESVTVQGNGGHDHLDVVDATGLTMGSILDPFGGIVYRPTGQFSGDLRFNGDIGTGLSKTLSETPDLDFAGITGKFRVAGDNGVGLPDLDTLTVLGYSTNTGTAPFDESTSANGSDTITVSDKMVSLTNAVAGPQLPVFLANNDVGGAPTLCNLVVLAGNENPPKGDTVIVTPSAVVNIFLDGMDPKCGVPGDKLIISPKPAHISIVRQLVDDPKKGPAGSVRIIDTGNPTMPSFGFIHFETVVGVSASVVGADAGSRAIVKLIDPTTGQPRILNTPSGPLVASFDAFPGFFGGVRVAAGDVNGDGIPDIVAAAGPGGGAHVKVYDGIDGSLIGQFFAYSPLFHGGVNVAVGDVDCDGMAEVITAPASAGGPHVRIFHADGTLVNEYFAYAPNFTGGVTVAAGDLDGDGAADIVTGTGEGGAPLVTARRGTDLSLISSFLAYDPTFRGGVFVGVGDVTGDDVAEIVTGAGNGGGPHLKVFNSNGSLITQFFVNDPFTPTQEPQVPRESGLRIALADVDGDGTLDILATKGHGTRPFLRSFHIKGGLSEAFRPYVFDPLTFGYGVFVGGSR